MDPNSNWDANKGVGIGSIKEEEKEEEKISWFLWAVERE
jgi:hypothetical protein